MENELILNNVLKVKFCVVLLKKMILLNFTRNIAFLGFNCYFYGHIQMTDIILSAID